MARTTTEQASSPKNSDANSSSTNDDEEERKCLRSIFNASSSSLLHNSNREGQVDFSSRIGFGNANYGSVQQQEQQHQTQQQSITPPALKSHKKTISWDDNVIESFGWNSRDNDRKETFDTNVDTTNTTPKGRHRKTISWGDNQVENYKSFETHDRDYIHHPDNNNYNDNAFSFDQLQFIEEHRELEQQSPRSNNTTTSSLTNTTPSAAPGSDSGTDNDNDNDNGTTSSDTTIGEQQLPSLSAAFTSFENRPILINCLLYWMVYCAIAVFAYSFYFEKWPIIDSLYFAVSTFTTTGYTILEPQTEGGKIFTIIFAIYGVIILGIFIGIFGNFISEAQTETMKRVQSKQQSRMLETLFHTKEDEEDNETNNNTSSNDSSHLSEYEKYKRKMLLKKESSLRRHYNHHSLEKSGFWVDHISLTEDIWYVTKRELPNLLLVMLLAFVLGNNEGWDPTDTLYFSIMAATSTGYGDFAPTTQLDKLYCIFYFPFAAAVFCDVLARISTVYITRKQRIAEQKFLHRSLTLCDLRNMDTNEDGVVDQEDFIVFMLIALQKVDMDTIEELREIFQKLDSNGNGLLEAGDFIEWAEENYIPNLEQVKKHVELEIRSHDELSELLFEREKQSMASTKDFSPSISQVNRKSHKRYHTIL